MKESFDPNLIPSVMEDTRRWYAADSSGHDWWHIYRVWKLSGHIAREEHSNEHVTALSALLHEWYDTKLPAPPEPSLPGYLVKKGFPTSVAEWIDSIVQGISFRKTGIGKEYSCLEQACVMDADKLDAMGAIGIARAFAYGGWKGQPMHDPTISPFIGSHSPTTVNHIYEKLLLLKEGLITSTARNFAENRHQFMLEFLRQFQEEWLLHK